MIVHSEQLDQHGTNQYVEAAQIGDPVESQIVRPGPRSPEEYRRSTIWLYISRPIRSTLEDNMPFYEPLYIHIRHQQWLYRNSMRFGENLINASSQEGTSLLPLQSDNSDSNSSSSPRVVQEHLQQHVQTECERLLHQEGSLLTPLQSNNSDLRHSSSPRVVQEYLQQNVEIDYEFLLYLTRSASNQEGSSFLVLQFNFSYSRSTSSGRVVQGHFQLYVQMEYESISNLRRTNQNERGVDIDPYTHRCYTDRLRTSPYHYNLFSPPVSNRGNTCWYTQSGKKNPSLPTPLNPPSSPRSFLFVCTCVQVYHVCALSI